MACLYFFFRLFIQYASDRLVPYEWVGVALGLLLVSVAFVTSCLYHVGSQAAIDAGIRLRSTVTGLIYRKVHALFSRNCEIRSQIYFTRLSNANPQPVLPVYPQILRLSSRDRRVKTSSETMSLLTQQVPGLQDVPGNMVNLLDIPVVVACGIVLLSLIFHWIAALTSVATLLAVSLFVGIFAGPPIKICQVPARKAEIHKTFAVCPFLIGVIEEYGNRLCLYFLSIAVAPVESEE